MKNIDEINTNLYMKVHKNAITSTSIIPNVINPFNEEVDTKGKTFNYSIEFKNGGFIKEENCTKTFDEIFNSVKELYNSPVFGSNIKKISIEIN